MSIERGTVVKSRAGHDRNGWFVVLSYEDAYAFIANGKSRTISSPKKKKYIHLVLTKTVLSEDEMESDRSILNALKRFDRKPSEGELHV